MTEVGTSKQQKETNNNKWSATIFDCVINSITKVYKLHNNQNYFFISLGKIGVQMLSNTNEKIVWHKFYWFVTLKNK